MPPQVRVARPALRTGERSPNPPARANRERIRTAQPGNRDRRGQPLAIGPEPGVSGAASAGSFSQDPAKAREFPGCRRVAGAESPQPQTSWRWGESGANPSLGRFSVGQGRYRESPRVRPGSGVLGLEWRSDLALLAGTSLRVGTGNGCRGAGLSRREQGPKPVEVCAGPGAPAQWPRGARCPLTGPAGSAPPPEP
jgi:hypothetical protein